MIEVYSLEEVNTHLEFVSVDGVHSPRDPFTVMRPTVTVRNRQSEPRRVKAIVRVIEGSTYQDYWLSVDTELDADETRTFDVLGSSGTMLMRPYDIQLEVWLGVYARDEHPATGSYKWFLAAVDNIPIEVRTYEGWWYLANKGLQVSVKPVEISSIILIVDGTEKTVPVSDINQGTNVRLSIQVINQSTASKNLGIQWVIRDPNNTVPHNGTGTMERSVAGGEATTFTSGDIPMNAVDNYTYAINSLIDGNIQQSMEGTLCTVLSVEEGTALTIKNITVVDGHYNPGDTVPYTVTYEYKGPAQSGTRQILLGQGWWSETSVEMSLDEQTHSYPAKSETTTISKQSSFVLPDHAERGAKYSARIRMKTDNGFDATTGRSGTFNVTKSDTPNVLEDLVIDNTQQEYMHRSSFVLSYSFDYSGIMQEAEATIAIGTGADEDSFAPVYTFAPVDIDISSSSGLETKTGEIENAIPNELQAGETYSVKLTVSTSDGNSASTVKTDIIKIDPDSQPGDTGDDYRTIKEFTYPKGESYQGDARIAHFEVTVDWENLTGDPASDDILLALEEEIEEEDIEPLHVKVYQKKQDWNTNLYLYDIWIPENQFEASSYFTDDGVVTNEKRVIPALSGLGTLLALATVLAAVLGAIGFVFHSIAEIKKWDTIDKWGYPPEDEDEDNGGFLGGIGDMLPTMIFMMIMMLMMQLMGEAMQGMSSDPAVRAKPKPVTTAIEKGTKEAGKFAIKTARQSVKLAESGVKAATAELDKIRAQKKAAKEKEKAFLEQREKEKLEKLRIARDELRRRREQRDNIEQQYA